MTINAMNSPSRDGCRLEAHADGETNQSVNYTMTSSSTHHQIPAIFKLRQQRLCEAVRRDILFLIFGAMAYVIVGYVETHASDAEIRLNIIHSSLSSNEDDDVCTENSVNTCTQQPSSTTPSKGIIDAGFIVTAPIHSYLARNRHVNDILAMANSILLSIPLVYVIYVTLWKGDFRLSFRLIATHLFRSLCGWFTYLPPDAEFLSSLYDFPELFLCMFQECSSHPHCAQVDFLTFFSGHVAIIVIIANHLYMAKHTRLSVCLHCFNWLQAIRLLATRGHYSIDLIVGYVVAVWVSSPAERLGLHYSQGIISPVLPGIVEAFEILVGVSVSEDGTRAVPKCSSRSNDFHNVQSETSVRIAVDIVADIAQMNR